VPLYEYKCRKCGKRSERIEKLNGPFLKKCPFCGSSVERLMSAPAIQFKGSGWYVTDYAKSSGGGAAEADKAAADKEQGKSAEKDGEKKPAGKEKEKKGEKEKRGEKEKKTVAKDTKEK
jgi:putative FmdB family regulatory protein